MSNRLFKRTAKLTLARPLKSADGIFEFFRLASGNAIEITKLRIAFEITKTLEKTANEAIIQVANLAESTRNEFARSPLHVRLDAGYDGSTNLLFKGDLRWSDSNPDGNGNWITELQCGDGARAIKEARISRNYKSGVNSKTVLKDMASSMGLKIPTSISDAKELVKQYAGGVTVSGPTSVEMGRLLARHGMKWSLQDGKLQILRKNDVRVDEAIVVSKDTGMIGSPEYGAPKKAGGKPTLTVKMLLESRANPGVKISMNSRSVKGVFKIKSVRHSGDTHETAWTTTIEATKV